MTLPTLFPPSAISPRSPRTSPRRASPEEIASIKHVITQWKRGEFDIDQTVTALLPASTIKKTFAREVYALLAEEVRAEPNTLILRGSRQALYATSIFSRMAECISDHNEMDAAYCKTENEILKQFPHLRGPMDKE